MINKRIKRSNKKLNKNAKCVYKVNNVKNISWLDRVKGRSGLLLAASFGIYTYYLAEFIMHCAMPSTFTTATWFVVSIAAQWWAMDEFKGSPLASFVFFQKDILPRLMLAVVYSVVAGAHVGTISCDSRGQVLYGLGIFTLRVLDLYVQYRSITRAKV